MHMRRFGSVNSLRCVVQLNLSYEGIEQGQCLYLLCIYINIESYNPV